jgi:copper resistance protein B
VKALCAGLLFACSLPVRATEMSAAMQMNDAQRFATVTFDQLEWRAAQPGAEVFWDAQAWYGGDYDKLRVKTQGSAGGESQDASAELLWDRIVSRWWSIQAGGRRDFGTGPGRTWLALGLQGVAPFWIDTEATVYFGAAGRTAARIKTQYDLYLTQRLILQPKAELNAYGSADPGRHLGAGLSDLDLGLRLRYEIRREFAPYFGLSWARLFGSTASRAKAADRSASDVEFVAGLRVWF